MYFRKIPHVANFAFLKKFKSGQPARIDKEKYEIDVSSFKGSMFRVRVKGPRWKKNYSQAGLKRPPKIKSPVDEYARMEVMSGFGLRLVGPGNQVLLSSPNRMTFGVCGRNSVFVFEQTPEARFYGMGEKMRGMELSGMQTKFWNTDIFADFHWSEISHDRPDPMYASVPYMIMKQGNQYIGLLLDNPHATFMSTGSNIEIGGGQMKLEKAGKKFITIGAEHGMPDLYIIVGPSLAELTRKLQKLVGTTPLPPAWALGYHQCRWGYKSEACMKLLDDQFSKHKIPCDGLWLDIDYMDSFKVFTFNKGYFPELKKALKRLSRNGRKIVPIIDPGVKKQKGYAVYDSGRRSGAFCRNPQGGEFVGLVWPGETVFPDFSMASARQWWAGHVRDFARNGFPGAWLDMNDPATGTVTPTDMLFNKGKDSHYTFHNQYALGMARASRDGFEQAWPEQRPFLLSRSAFTGMSKYAALWTGDNMSSYHYLRNCIAVSLNLSLSGIPFNGPDIGGFAGDTTPQLLTDWTKACFLFPFCRNHSMIGTKDQEPWAFGMPTMRILKHYIQLRYKLRPYLYNLFIQQEEEGESILRPLLYHFADTAEMPLDTIDDQFMVGPSILQAPILDEQQRTRDVVLPGRHRWYSALDAAWRKPGRLTGVKPGDRETPVYFRENSILPMAPGLPTDNEFNPREIEFHVFLTRSSDEPAVLSYQYDDGKTFEYREGKRSSLLVTGSVHARKLALSTEQVMSGYGTCKKRFVLYDTFDAVTINGHPAKLRKATIMLAGVKQSVTVAS